MADQFYFIVSPNPVQFPNGVTNAAGQQMFFIKFGDGLGNTRYNTHNPSYQIAQNNHTAGSGTYGVPGQGGPGVRIGSFVETQLLNALNLVNVNGTEWYHIRPGAAGGIAGLQAWLVAFLAAFPNQNFDGTGVQTSDQVAYAWIIAQRAAMGGQGFH